jgi:hypothetical protein
MGKKKLTQADREMIERALANADRLRQLAEKGQAELDKRKRERESG